MVGCDGGYPPPSSAEGRAVAGGATGWPNRRMIAAARRNGPARPVPGTEETDGR